MTTVATPAPDGSVFLPGEAATEAAGRALGRALEEVVTRELPRFPAAPHPRATIGERGRPGAPHAAGALILGLEGGLGMGKTTLARAALRDLGVTGVVRSPTYTIAEPYETRIGDIWHLDLYRLADPRELEFIAVRDLVADSVACLVEWPERGHGGMPEPDCLLSLAPDGPARRLRIEPRTVLGSTVDACVRACMGLEPSGVRSPGT